MTLSFDNMTVNLNIFNVIKGMGDEEDTIMKTTFNGDTIMTVPKCR